jgi:hypothetical protein
MISSLGSLVVLSVIVACRPYVAITTTTVQHSDFDLEPANRNEITLSQSILQVWLAGRGYTKLRTPAEIEEATIWAGTPSYFSEVYAKPISPSFPQSRFVVTISENPTARFFQITLTSAVKGTKAEHAAQRNTVAAEEESFQRTLRAGQPAQ